jgi:pantoate--beta-alanine ligase
VGKQLIEGGRGDVAEIERAMRQTIEQAPAIRIEYLAVCDPDNLEPLSIVTNRAVLLGAIRLGPVRLIDNLPVKIPGGKSRATR